MRAFLEPSRRAFVGAASDDDAGTKKRPLFTKTPLSTRSAHRRRADSRKMLIKCLANRPSDDHRPGALRFDTAYARPLESSTKLTKTQRFVNQKLS